MLTTVLSKRISFTGGHGTVQLCFSRPFSLLVEQTKVYITEFGNLCVGIGEEALV